MTEHPRHPHPREEPLPEPVGPEGMPDGPTADEVCDYCGSPHLEWRKCKLICRTCAQINKSCADL
jgi:hypothetical protein